MKSEISPVTALRERWGISKEDLAAVAGITRRYVDVLDQGGAHSLPKTLLEQAEKIEGRPAREALEKAYAKFRADLEESCRSGLKEKFFPAVRSAVSPSQV